MSEAHHHHHHHGHGESVARIRLAFFLNLVFAIVEFIGGAWSGSVAVIADAVHDLGDAVSLGLAWYLEKRAQGGPNQRFTYGLRRLSLLSALITGVVLVTGSAIIVGEAVRRLMQGGGTPDGLGMMILAGLGLIVNGFAAYRLMRGRTLNERMLSWHLVEDVLGWAAVLVGAVCIRLWQWNWIDAVLAVGIAGFVSWNAVKNLFQTILVFLQHVPANFDQILMRQRIAQVGGVLGVHDVHVWSLDGDHHVASLHLVVKDLLASRQIKAQVRELCHEFGVVHATIECESSGDECQENCDI